MRVEPLAGDVAARLRDATFTYPAVGATADDVTPAGHRRLRRSRRLRAGADFETCATALMSWELHTKAGISVSASSPVAEPDAVVVLGIGIGSLRLWAPCRVVYVVSEEIRRGFAYGTLPGHPESGEERFLVERVPDGAVVVSVGAFSRPTTRLARLGGPVTRLVQERITARYLRALDA